MFILQITLEGLKSKLVIAEEERDALRQEQYDVLERVTTTEALHMRDSQLRRDAERNLEKERADNKILRQRLVEARADARVVELERKVEEYEEKLQSLQEEMNLTKVILYAECIANSFR